MSSTPDATSASSTTTEVAVPEATKVVEKTRDQHLKDSYSSAQASLRDAHLDEFNGYRKDHLKSVGIDWKPEPTEQEKAAAQIADLLRQFPDLVAQIQGAQ